MFENFKEALTELPYYMVLVVGLCAVILGLMRMLLSIPPPPPIDGYKWFKSAPKPPLTPQNHIDHPLKPPPNLSRARLKAPRKAEGSHTPKPTPKPPIWTN